MIERPTIGFIGVGKVGSTLAQVWSKAGYRITSVYSRTQAHAITLASQVQAISVATPKEIVQSSDLIVLTVPDDEIESVADSLSGENWQDKAAIHTSGAHNLHSLDKLAAQGAMTGTLHPAFPFASVATALKQLSGATFALEASHDVLREWLQGLVIATGGNSLLLSPENKTLYHAALVIASNYTVTLYAAAERLLTGLGASQTIVDQALNTLVRATVENIQHQGVPAALTGPLVRDDSGTIQGHLTALHQIDPEIEHVYRHLARLTYPLLLARGVAVDNIEFILQKNEKSSCD
ncbi:MAG TPA: DUF2520 domain-containing protein [Phototrophicaceae bacterium]|jgi:predicted short-subunit dehydrogenase-like oxidoreductase (DUF2520 family)|nr:DUF2520 domain-containing protein [Phototrophicaceae bacterium]